MCGLRKEITQNIWGFESNSKPVTNILTTKKLHKANKGIATDMKEAESLYTFLMPNTNSSSFQIASKLNSLLQNCSR